MKSWQNCALPDSTVFPERYTVLEMISESPVSSILLCFDGQLDCKVVIKCFKQTLKSAYLREIGAVYDMKHPNLVRCLTTFHSNEGDSCLVYEYFPEGNLAELLKAAQRLSVDEVFCCLQDILKALIYLNSLNRIHCDIKPENIFLRLKTNGDLEYVLGDLGAACFLREAQEGHHVTGTPAYIAPERIRNQFFFNSDLYSLGIVAYELCTGERPFVGNVEEITQANLSEIPSLETVEYPPLRDLIDHLLAKSPQKRIEQASLAYFYVEKLQKQHGVTLNRQGRSASGFGKQNDLKLQQVSLMLKVNPLALHCFHVNDQVLIALTYACYTDIFDPNYPDKVLHTFVHTHSIQVIGPTTIAYSTPTRIQLLNLESMAITTLIQQINNPKKFYFYNNNLLFSNDFNVYFHDLNDNSHFSFRSPSYFSDIKTSVFENGTFCMSTGIANEKLIKRDKKGAILCEWLLDGPLVAMTPPIDKLILGASLSVNDQNKYSIWCLHDFETVQKRVLDEKIRQISCTENAVYWLTEHAELYCCGIDFQHKMLGSFNQTTTKFAVSFDGLYIVTLDCVDPNKAIITIFNNQDS